jgi:hypothetical protein
MQGLTHIRAVQRHHMRIHHLGSQVPRFISLVTASFP